MQSRSPTLVSEFFPLGRLSQINSTCFSTTPAITDPKLGRQVAYRCTYFFPNIIAVWTQGTFLVAATLSTSTNPTLLPSSQQWQAVLDQIASELKVDIGWRYTATYNPLQGDTIAELAAAILTQKKPFKSETAINIKGIEVIRTANHWKETFQANGQSQSAIAITPKSKFFAAESLSSFYEARKHQADVSDLLLDMVVEELELNSCGTIVNLYPISEHRERLLRLAKGKRSREALSNAPDDQPLAAVKFSKDSPSTTL